MASKKLFVTDERMLKVMHYVVTNSFMNISSQSAFCDAIGVLKGAISNIRTGKRGFTTEHILRAHELFGADLNYIFGKSDRMFMNDKENVSPIQLLKQAVAAVDAAYNTKTTVGLISRKKAPSAKTSVKN